MRKIFLLFLMGALPVGSLLASQESGNLVSLSEIRKLEREEVLRRKALKEGNSVSVEVIRRLEQDEILRRKALKEAQSQAEKFQLATGKLESDETTQRSETKSKTTPFFFILLRQAAGGARGITNKAV